MRTEGRGGEGDDVGKVHNLFKSPVDYDSKVGLITCFAFFPCTLSLLVICEML
jgi:hypothetical protein